MTSGFRSRKGVTKSDGGEGDRPNGRPNYFLGKYVKYALFERIYGGLRFRTSFMRGVTETRRNRTSGGREFKNRQKYRTSFISISPFISILISVKIFDPKYP